MTRIAPLPDHGEPVSIVIAERKALTTLEKLKVLVRYSRCGICGERLGELPEVDWDHIWELADGGDNSLDNMRPVHKACHKAKTRAAQKDRAKGRRIRGENKPRRKAKIPSRPFQKREKETRG